MVDNVDVKPWGNQEPANKNLEQLSVVINQLTQKISELEARINTLENG